MHVIPLLDQVDDYMPVSLTLTFDDERQKCIHITIIDDMVLERPVESFKLTLTRTEGLDERIQFTANEGGITIRENDGNQKAGRLAVYG